MQRNCKYNSLFTFFPSHQVSISTHMHSVHFSTFSMHYAQCTSHLWHHTNMGYNAVAGDSGAGSHLPRTNRQSLLTKYVEKVGKLKYCGSIHTLQPPPDQGGDMCKVWFRSVQKCRFVLVPYKQTNKQTFIFIYKIIWTLEERDFSNVKSYRI